MVPFTIAFNYTDKISSPVEIHPNFGKYYPLNSNYKIEKTLDSIINKSLNISQKVLIVSQDDQCKYILDPYLSHNFKEIKILNGPFNTNILEFRNTSDKKTDYSEYLVKEDNFNLKRLEIFTYIIFIERINLQVSGEFSSQYEKIYLHILNNPDKFGLYKEIRSGDSKENMEIYKVG